MSTSDEIISVIKALNIGEMDRTTILSGEDSGLNYIGNGSNIFSVLFSPKVMGDFENDMNKIRIRFCE